ncbi:CAP domain-containing protein [Lactobacillaceae bacterium Melli_B4]
MGTSFIACEGSDNVYASSNANKKQKIEFLSYTDTGFYRKYIGTNGTIYKDSALKHKLSNLSKYKNKPFKSKEAYEYKLPNGKEYYFYKIKGNGITGYINSKYLHKYNAPKKKVINNTDSDDNQHKINNNNLSQYYSASEIDQIKQYQQQASQINNSDKDSDVYNTLPIYQNGFSIGELKPSFIDANVQWINLLRGMYGLSSVNDNPQWNIEAQYGATALASVDNGLSHGLVGFTKPSFVSDDDWKRGAAATNQSNLATSGSSYENIGIYINDPGNAEPGHREWLLGGINQVGIGQSGKYNDLMVFNTADKNWATPEKDIEFPKAGLFPYDLSYDTYWSYSLSSGSFNNPTVTITDNTTGKNVSVSDVHVSSASYGHFQNSLSFEPNTDDIQLNHSYNIMITGTPNGTYSYTTKLYDMGPVIFNHQNQ